MVAVEAHAEKMISVAAVPNTTRMPPGRPGWPEKVVVSSFDRADCQLPPGSDEHRARYGLADISYRNVPIAQCKAEGEADAQNDQRLIP